MNAFCLCQIRKQAEMVAAATMKDEDGRWETERRVDGKQAQEEKSKRKAGKRECMPWVRG